LCPRRHRACHLSSADRRSYQARGPGGWERTSGSAGAAGRM
jgi:hypothetical protein